MGLQELWFILIAVLFTGYFVLEGFDFGVGMLMPVLGRSSPKTSSTRSMRSFTTGIPTESTS